MRSLVFLLLFATGVCVAGERQIFRSADTHVMLLELYTSEGCSSCPPADKWFRTLMDDPDLWRRVVPVALHVDYWNRLGWKDRFSDSRFSQRQRAYADEWGTATVYTPAFVLDGERWRPSGQWKSPPVASSDTPGDLFAAVESGRVSVRFEAGETGPAAVDAHVAVLGFGLETRVSAGENRGRLLRHDFVATVYRTVPLQGPGGGELHGSVDLSGAFEAGGRRALAVWVSPENSPRPLQAVGGWLR
ncbi:MAG: DUF1223 domain-containing protein [Ectothiorhodospiraceae bacterium]|jgi:hypothetical protein